MSSQKCPKRAQIRRIKYIYTSAFLNALLEKKKLRVDSSLY